MKYLKLYETLHEKPKVGQYVNLLEDEDDNDFFKWLSSQILMITNIHRDKPRLLYDVELLKNTIVPKELQDNYSEYFENGTMVTMWFDFDNFEYWADTKEEIELRLQTNKYNI